MGFEMLLLLAQGYAYLPKICSRCTYLLHQLTNDAISRSARYE
jgi:hypothetical protein